MGREFFPKKIVPWLVALCVILLSANFLFRPTHWDVNGSVARSMIAAFPGFDFVPREHRPLSYSFVINALVYPLQIADPTASPLETAFFLRLSLLLLCGAASISASYLMPEKNLATRSLFSLLVFCALISVSYWIAGQPEFIASLSCLMSIPFLLNKRKISILVASALMSICILMKIVSITIAASFLIIIYSFYPTLRRRTIITACAAIFIAITVLLVENAIFDEFDFLLLSTLSQGNSNISPAKRIFSFFKSISGIWAHIPLTTVALPAIAWFLIKNWTVRPINKTIIYIISFLVPAISPLSQGVAFTYQFTGIIIPFILFFGFSLVQSEPLEGPQKIRGYVFLVCLIPIAFTTILILIAPKLSDLTIHNNGIYLIIIITLVCLAAVIIVTTPVTDDFILSRSIILIAVVSLLTDNAFTENHRRDIQTIRNVYETFESTLEKDEQNNQPTIILYLTSARGAFSIPQKSACDFIYPVPLQRAGKSTKIRNSLSDILLYQKLLTCAKNYDGPYVLWEPQWFPQEAIANIGLSELLSGYEVVARKSGLVLLAKK